MRRSVLCCLILGLSLIGVSGVRPLVVHGTSMEPALLPGQIALLDRNYYRTHPLERGQVVVFRWKDHVYVKRVHALAGERVALAGQQGYFMLLDAESEARARQLVRRKPRFQFRSLVVPPGHVFCLGDWLSTSVDSREIGPIPTTAILGRVRYLSGKEGL